MTDPKDQNPPEEYQRPDFFKGSSVFFGSSKLAAFSWILFIEVLALGIVIAMFYPSSVKTPVNPVKRAAGWDTLTINGNRNKHAVAFPHQTCSRAVTIKRLDSLLAPGQGVTASHLTLSAADQRQDCRFCHHLSVPGGGPSACADCHRTMLDSVNIFDHLYHERAAGKNPSCTECHGSDKAKEKVKACSECHKDYGKDLKLTAPGYKAAMHNACAPCHPEVDLTGTKEEYSDCKICHRDIDVLMKR